MAQRWSIQFSTGDSLEVIFVDMTTLAELQALYPGALSAAPTTETRRTATPAESHELRALIASVIPEAPESEQAEALALAIDDADAALICYRALVAELEHAAAKSQKVRPRGDDPVQQSHRTVQTQER